MEIKCNKELLDKCKSLLNIKQCQWKKWMLVLPKSRLLYDVFGWQVFVLAMELIFETSLIGTLFIGFRTQFISTHSWMKKRSYVPIFPLKKREKVSDK